MISTPKGLLNALPIKSEKKLGWPWTEETNPLVYKELKELPKITIVTPTKNQGEFIEETIRSILLQNYPNLEYIIIDGGSTDNTLQIIKKYEGWISHWVSEEDGGQTHAINKGFKLASGEIINWINSDDLLAPNGLFNVIERFEKNPDVHFVHGQNLTLDLEGKPQLFEPPNLNNLALEYLGSFPYVQPACFYKRSVLKTTGLLDESFHITMDKDFFVRIALNFNIKYIDRPIAIFREQKNAKTCHYSGQWDEERVKVFSKLMRSVGAEKEIISTLQSIGIYDSERESYPLKRKFSIKEIIEVVSIFMRDSIKLNFFAGNFEKSYQLAKCLKKEFPEFFVEELNGFLIRSGFYQHPVLFFFSRMLKKVISLFPPFGTVKK